MAFLTFAEIKALKAESRDLLAEREHLQAGGYVQERRLGRVPSRDEVTSRLAQIAERLAFIANEIDTRSPTTHGIGVKYTGHSSKE